MLDLNLCIEKSILSGAKGGFSMFEQFIQLEGPTVEECEPTLYHEYTHYLQNMTTFHCFTNFENYMSLFLSSFATLGCAKNDPIIPLCHDTNLVSKYGDKNLTNFMRLKYIGMINNDNHYEFYESGKENFTLWQEDLYDKYNNELKKVAFISYNNFKIPLNEVTIKENMALMNTIISNKKTDILDSDDIEIIKNQSHYEYTIIYLFLNNYLSDKNIVKLVYTICEIALNILPIHKTIYEILDFVQTNISELLTKNTEEIIEIIYSKISYFITINAYNEAYTNIAKQKISSYDLIIQRDKNEFIELIKEFYQIILKGLEIRIQYKTLYTENLDLQYLDNFGRIIGCPVIYYPNLIYGPESKMLPNVPAFFHNKYAYLHGSLLLYLKAYNNTLTTCPFYEKFICQYPKNQDCDFDCIKNWEKNGYENCLLNNALICTGIRQKGRTIS